MTKKIAWFIFGSIISIAGIALADSYGTFSPATGILKGNAASPVTSAATAADVNALYNGADFRAGQTVTNCNLANATTVACSEASGKAAAQFLHTRVGNGAQVVANFSNFSDADFGVTISEIGAGSKYALIGPSVNIPLLVRSRGTAQEFLKSASFSVDTNGTVIRAHNLSFCVRVQTGIVTCNYTAAAFTTTPVCTCSIVSAPGECSPANTVDAFGTQIGMRNSSGQLIDGLVANVVCVGR